MRLNPSRNGGGHATADSIPHGGVHCVYGELIPLLSLGVVAIRRASTMSSRLTTAGMPTCHPSTGPSSAPIHFVPRPSRPEGAWLERHLLDLQLLEPVAERAAARADASFLAAWGRQDLPRQGQNHHHLKGL